MTTQAGSGESSPPLPSFAPLTGTRVLEWCEQVAGPFAGKVLAGLGADVIKIEAPLTGDVSRQSGPFPGDLPDSEQSALFLYLNNGKRSITLDPSTSDGRALLLRLIAEWADVLLEDRPPAVMEAAGLDYAAVSASKPELVVVSVTPFGQRGPYRDFKLYPAQTSHAGGAAYILPDGNHYEDEATLPPMQWPRFVSDYSVGVLTAGGTMAALRAKQLTGRGQHVDVSKQQAQMHPMRYVLDAYPNEGVIRKRHNAPKPPGVVDRTTISGTYECADGWVAL